MPRVVASIEARMAATRLPGKMMMDLNGLPVIERLVRRLEASRQLDGLVLATTSNPKDDVLADWARRLDLAVYRGSEDDVLARVVEAQASQRSDIVVEICGDCPLIDPEVVDLAISTFLANDADVVTTTQVPSWPQGIDVQVFTFEALARVSRDVSDPAVREHVSLYFYEHPEKYRILNLLAPDRASRPSQRCQLDYAEDLDFLRAVCEQLDPDKGLLFSTWDLCYLLTRMPALSTINAACSEKPAR